MKSFKTNLFLKISLIVVIALLLFIPTSMIKDLIRERENTQRNAIQEVSSKWGEVQTVSGPYVSVPYYKNVKQYSTKDSA
ncbi:MAG: cell envelope integrity protein CreD, partial [Bacteroidetes bacterium]|nr:cell envelope integrity protein CreD [Bacteroidota bacterium]